MKRFTTSKILLLASLLIAPMLASADVVAGKALYSSCVACHGANAEGNPAMNAPALNGQFPEYLARQLNHFKDGIRGADAKDSLGMQMRAMTAVLADKQAITDVSEYIASLPVTAVATKIEGDVRNGNNLYQGNCGSCHGGKGEGNQALNSPRLAGLDEAYLIRQINNFKQGIRGTHQMDRFGRQMKLMANTVRSDKDLLDMAAYLHALPVQ
ncbi:c-type cytochrome [Oceanicoccus sp. KOV_DT_Chl]|uniref:c-type cytochrome n=1 Tax=Oceanicoccus sp. KOV_DT_Chl TaxID=1904639 RepID=UPI000C7ACD66|nr:c-type cytochrome [Oceanicoccus sp. KOV_DT_Chl]